MAGDGLCCIPGSSRARGRLLTEHPRLGLPYLPHLLLLYHISVSLLELPDNEGSWQKGDVNA